MARNAAACEVAEMIGACALAALCTSCADDFSNCLLQVPASSKVTSRHYLQRSLALLPACRAVKPEAEAPHLRTMYCLTRSGRTRAKHSSALTWTPACLESFSLVLPASSHAEPVCAGESSVHRQALHCSIGLPCRCTCASV